MNSKQAKEQIRTGIEQYEAGRITLTSLFTLVDATVDALESVAFNAGLDAVDADDYSEYDSDMYDVEFLEDEE